MKLINILMKKGSKLYRKRELKKKSTMMYKMRMKEKKKKSLMRICLPLKYLHHLTN